MFKSVSNIIEWFKEEGLPYYVIFCRDGIIARNKTVSDIDEAANKLEKTLTRLDDEEQFGMKYIVYLYDFPPPVKFNKNETAGCATLLREKKQRDISESGGGYLWQQLQQQQAQILELQQALIKATAEDDKEIEEKTDNNVVGAILNHPILQPVIAGLITKYIGGETKPQAVAGVPINNDIDRIGAAIERLMKHDTALAGHLETLADIAENNPKQFKFLLGMLNNM